MHNEVSPHVDQNGHIENPTTIKSAEGVEKGMLLHCGWEYKLVKLSAGQFALKNKLKAINI